MENLKDIIEIKNRNYKKVPCYGKIITESKEYLLLAPHPVQGFDSWIREGERAFYVVATDFIGSTGEFPLYNYPVHIIVSGNWVMQLKTSRIYIRMFDNEFESLVDPDDPGFDGYLENFSEEKGLTKEKTKGNKNE